MPSKRVQDGAGFWNCTGNVCDAKQLEFDKAIQGYYTKFIARHNEQIKQDNIHNKNQYKNIYTKIPLLVNNRSKLKEISTLLIRTTAILNHDSIPEKYSAFMKDPLRFMEQAYYFADSKRMFIDNIQSFLNNHNPTKEDIADILLNDVLKGENIYSKYNNFNNSDVDNNIKKAYRKYIERYLEQEANLRKSATLLKNQATSRLQEEIARQQTTFLSQNSRAQASTSTRTTSRQGGRRAR